VLPLAERMHLTAVNTWGGVAADRLRFLDRLSPLLPVGFYYKAFHGRLFPWWERLIRRGAGLGAINARSPRAKLVKRYDHCDVLVVGAGPSGLAAACAAAEAGAHVVLADENARPGGSLTWQRAAAPEARELLAELLGRAAALPNLELRAGCYAAGRYDDHLVALVDARGMTKMRCRALVAAAGVQEQPAVFRNNDLPGVMLGSAAQRLIHRYAVKPGERAVVLAGNEEAWDVALDLRDAGVVVAAVVDFDRGGSPGRERLRAAGVEVIEAACVYEAHGKERVESVTVCAWDGDRARTSQPRAIACDLVAMSVGWAPAGALLYQSGAHFAYDAALEQLVPEALPPGTYAAGRVNGVYALADRAADGARAGREAAAFAGFAAPSPLRAPPRAARPHSHPYPIVEHARGKNFVDFDEDLQLKDLAHAAQEGFDSIELIKRFSTVGMGPSQGKHSNMNAIRILARLTGKPVGEVGTTTSRPFYHPVPLAALAGRGFHPERRSPLHALHDERGAVFMAAGDWKRPEFYACRGWSREACIRAEAKAVRTGVGLIDVSTLGKIEVSGPDAAAFLERLYTGAFATQKPGTTRYALMLDESGVVVDDGVAARLAEDRFYITTTTSGAGGVYREMQRWAQVWGMNLGLVNLTGAYAAMNLAGPRAREVLATLTKLDVTESAFPFLAVREAEVAGVPARLLRVGFVGELAYEIHVPADAAAHLWSVLMKEGTALGIRAFGVEAQRLLRLEKGHVIVGQDTDGLTHPLQAGLGWAVKIDKPFFVGQRSLRAMAAQRRPRLVGFALDPGHGGEVPKENHLVIRDGRIAGRVTSVAMSETLGRVIGLAYVDPAQAEPGTRFCIRAASGMVWARVVPTPFYDPENARQKGRPELKEVLRVA
jgi:sarcosine oxidase subunit alpha